MNLELGFTHADGSAPGDSEVAKGKGKCPGGKTIDSASDEAEMPREELAALTTQLKVRDEASLGVEKGGLIDQVLPEHTKQINDGDDEAEADFYVANEEGGDGEITYSLAKHIVLVFEHNDGDNCCLKLAQPPADQEIQAPDVWMTVQYRLHGCQYTSYGSLVRNYWLKNRDQRKWEQVRLVKIAQILTRWQRAEHDKKSQAMRAKAKEWADMVTSGRKPTQVGNLRATEESLRAYNDEHDGVLDDIFAEATAAVLSRPETYDADDEQEAETEEADTEAETEAAGLGIRGDGNGNSGECRAGPSAPRGPKMDDPLELAMEAVAMARARHMTAEQKAQLMTLDRDSLGIDVSDPDFTPPEGAKTKTKGVYVRKKDGDGHIVTEKARGWVKKQKRGRRG